MSIIYRLLLIGFVLFCAPALADESLPYPALETRAKAIGNALHCIDCGSETINNAETPTAKEMRYWVREKLKEGWSDAQIYDYARARYGDYILTKPLARKTSYIWWISAILTLLTGILLGNWAFVRRKNIKKSL